LHLYVVSVTNIIFVSMPFDMCSIFWDAFRHSCCTPNWF